jgi:hypothetical protein
MTTQPRKPQYVQINQMHQAFHDYLSDAEWMAARIDDDIIYDATVGYFFFDHYKRLGDEQSCWWPFGGRGKEHLFLKNSLRVSQVPDPLDWWHDVLTHPSWRHLEVYFDIPFNSPCGKYFIPRDASSPAATTQKVDEARWSIRFHVDCAFIFNIRSATVCFFRTDPPVSCPIHLFESCEYERVHKFYENAMIARYALLVLFDYDNTFSTTATDAETGLPIPLSTAIAESNVPGMDVALELTSRRVFIGDRELPATAPHYGVEGANYRAISIYCGTREKLLSIEKWFLDNSDSERVTRVWSRADMRFSSVVAREPRCVFREAWMHDSAHRAPRKHAYMVERAVVLMHMLLAPCAHGATLTPAQAKASVRVRIVLPVYVLLWIFEWLPDEFLEWDEVSRLRCLTGVQHSLRRVLQARPDLDAGAVGKRTRSAKRQDWL